MEHTRSSVAFNLTTKEYQILMILENETEFYQADQSLRRSGLKCELVWAGTAESALTLIGNGKFDIIVVDLFLPDGNGLELVRNINGSGQDVPIILLCDPGNVQKVVEAFRFGVQDYLLREVTGEYLNLLPYVIIKVYKQWKADRERWRAELDLRNLNKNLNHRIEEGTREIREQAALTTAILGSLESQMAMLDAEGNIIEVNSAWNRFARENGSLQEKETGVGVNYLEITRKAAESGDGYAKVVLDGLLDVLAGRREWFSTQYPCHSPVQDRWFNLLITPVRNHLGGVVATHTDITNQVMILKQEQEQRLWAETLQEISRILNQSLEIEDVLRGILEQLARVVPLETASVMLRDRGYLEVVAFYGPAPKPKYSKRLHIRDLAHVAVCLDNKEPVYVPDTREDPRWILYKGTEYIRSWAGIPLIVQNQTIGVLNLNHSSPNAFSEKIIQMTVSFANHAALAIENAKLYSQAKKEIEERKRAEEALEEERAMLAQRVSERTVELTRTNLKLYKAMMAKDHFLANMSHELRTPLTAILGKIEVLLEGVYDPLTDSQRRAAKIIESSGEHLLSLINDILDVAQIEAGQFNITFEKVALRSLCESSIQFVLESANKKGITVHKRYDTSLKTIVGDNRRLKQILVNLLNNAVKFTPEGGEIGLDVYEDMAQDQVKFVVWDTGIGISKEGRKHLFGDVNRPRPFFQIENTLSRQFPGSGLGLVLVYTLTAMHNGSIQLKSKPGKGTQITVSLPVSKPDWRGGPSNKEKSEFGGVVPVLPEPSTNRGYRILLAEDNHITVDSLVDYLTYCGFDVCVVPDGEKVVIKAAEMVPDLIIMDVQLPKQNGLEAIRQIRNEVGLLDTPIIALTALTMPGDKEMCLKAGANDYIRKPFNLPQFNQILDKYLIRTGVE